MHTHVCRHTLRECIILFTSRYQLELKEEYIARTNKVTEDEKKNKGNHLSEINKIPVSKNCRDKVLSKHCCY